MDRLEKEVVVALLDDLHRHHLDEVIELARDLREGLCQIEIGAVEPDDETFCGWLEALDVKKEVLEEYGPETLLRLTGRRSALLKMVRTWWKTGAEDEDLAIESMIERVPGKIFMGIIVRGVNSWTVPIESDEHEKIRGEDLIALMKREKADLLEVC